MKLNTAAACGIMANIYHESRFKHYAEGDINISGGPSFGLCQWRESRKANLKNYCNQQGISMESVEGQLAFMNYELQKSYKSVYNTLTSVPNTASGAYDAAHKFCISYEVPADRNAKGIERGNLARTSYWDEYSGGVSLPAGVSFPISYGSEIVRIAREQDGKPYSAGGVGPDSFDSAGLIYYSYNTAGYTIDRMTPDAYYTKFSTIGKSVTLNEIRAGDLLFYKDSQKVYLIAIADGEGGRIYVNTSQEEVVVDKSIIGSPYAIIRILSDAETSQYNATGGYENAVEDFTALTTIDPYYKDVTVNLSNVESVGFDYGYLIDLTHKQEFKFYIPEFTESAGANWESVNIIGRSVDIKAYNNTNSRVISISLDLYAGVGLYVNSGDGDVVGKLHKDANFIKSLEYPDYTNAIVRPPATVQLILGSSINIVGVVSDVSVEHMKPLDSQNRSMYLKVNFTVTQTAVNPPDYSDIKNGRYVLPSTGDISSITTTDDKTNAPNFTG